MKLKLFVLCCVLVLAGVAAAFSEQIFFVHLSDTHWGFTTNDPALRRQRMTEFTTILQRVLRRGTREHDRKDHRRTGLAVDPEHFSRHLLDEGIRQVLQEETHEPGILSHRVESERPGR
jgi:hypothetical protein